jgi:type I restriction enzyme S subunit
MGSYWIDETEDQLTEAGVAKATRVVPPGTVLMLTRGMTLHKRVPICRIRRNAAFNQDVKAILPKAGVSARFLPYLMTGNHERLHALVDSAGHGTGRINTPELLSLKVWIPEFREQDAIGEIGEALDDRIDLLRQTNATLEAIAQALFKSWFVDFDPVRAKAEGREPEGMDPTTASLFPSEFEDSELGLIPKGWRTDEIGRIVQCVGGATPSTKEPSYWDDPIFHWVTPKDLSALQAPVLIDTERKVSKLGLTKISSGLLPIDTVLLSSRAPIGYLAIAQVPTAINQGFIAMLPGGELPSSFLLFWTKRNMDSIKQKANGSTFMEISKAAFRPIKLVVPDRKVVEAFHSLVKPMLDRIAENERQRSQLAQIRDTLLPRLISGKLRLPEAEAAIEGVGA